MKIVSFTFDDGLINTAKKVVQLKIPSTFYIVTNWLQSDSLINDSFNFNLNHGNIKEWKDLSSQGLDIGSHGHFHKKYKDKNFFLKDLFLSYDIIKNFQKPLNFSYPFGEKIFDCPRFHSAKVGFLHFFNKINSFYISSYNPLFDSKKELKEIIEEMPDCSWLVLTFHGINEGWVPCNEQYILEHFEYCLFKKIKVKTISEVLLFKKFL